MPYRLLAASKLAEFLNAISHPRRIQIIEELKGGERNVGALQEVLEISHSNVSQHLAVLRAIQVVCEHREGRQVFYRLCSPELAEWLVNGLQFLPAAAADVEQVKAALRAASIAWESQRNPDENRP